MIVYTRVQHFSFILNQTNPVHTLRICHLQIRFNIIFPSTPRFFQLICFLQVSPPKHISLCLYSLNMPLPSHPPSFHHPNNNGQIVQFSSGTSFSLPHRLTYLPQHRYLPPITIKYQVPHPHITPKDVSKSKVLLNISRSVCLLR